DHLDRDSLLHNSHLRAHYLCHRRCHSAGHAQLWRGRRGELQNYVCPVHLRQLAFRVESVAGDVVSSGGSQRRWIQPSESRGDQSRIFHRCEWLCGAASPAHSVRCIQPLDPRPDRHRNHLHQQGQAWDRVCHRVRMVRSSGTSAGRDCGGIFLKVVVKIKAEWDRMVAGLRPALRRRSLPAAPAHQLSIYNGSATMYTAEVVLIGGGIVASSIAFHLVAAGCRNVLVIERETAQGKGSTGKSMGGVRAQFSTPVNIQMSLYSIPFYASFEERLGYPCDYRPQGYLFCATSEKHLAYLRANYEKQIAMGLRNVRLVTGDEIRG